jgi:hypothetical protein
MKSKEWLHYSVRQVTLVDLTFEKLGVVSKRKRTAFSLQLTVSLSQIALHPQSANSQRIRT